MGAAECVAVPLMVDARGKWKRVVGVSRRGEGGVW